MNERLRIGKRLSQLRKERGLSLRDVAELTGLDHSNISKIENGKYNAGIDILSKICTALGARIEITKLSGEE